MLFKFRQFSERAHRALRLLTMTETVSRSTSHVKQYIKDPTPQREPDVLKTPSSLPTEEPATGLLDSLDLQENIGANSEKPSTLRPQKTRRLPERLNISSFELKHSLRSLVLSDVIVDKIENTCLCKGVFI